MLLYKSKLFELTADERGFEWVERSPGVRLLIIHNKKILITKEYRAEIKRDDYRLPGGKVFDTLQEYKEAKDVKRNVINAAKRECKEETGLLPIRMKLLCATHAGATIIWDLYYFVVDRFKTGKQHLGDEEDIALEWKTFAQVKKLCLTGKISEDRTVGVLLRFLMGGLE